jgi:hypothetical protein
MKDNHSTETLLPLHIKLQGLYPKDWLVGDEVSYRGMKTIISGITNLHVGLELGLNPRTWFSNDDLELIKIPRTIDDSSPEAQKRSLIGMLVGYSEVCWRTGKDGAYIHNYPEDVEGGGKFIHGSSPTHAILLALMSQEGLT